MKKKMLPILLLYYILLPLIYAGILYGCAIYAKTVNKTANLGVAIGFVYIWTFVVLPTSIIVLMRFSLLKWYVDPFAAAVMPILYYLNLLIGEMKHTGEFNAAFLLTNRGLSDDGGLGWIFLAGMFVCGLVASFSFARKRGESISYRLLVKTGFLKPESI